MKKPRPKVGASSKEKANLSWGRCPRTPGGHSSPRIEDPRFTAGEARGILAFSRKAYGIEESSLLSSRRGVLNEPRNVAIFLMRRLRGEKLEEIGRQFGIAKYSSVSSAIEKMKRDISVDRRIKARVESIEKILENSQQQICPLFSL